MWLGSIDTNVQTVTKYSPKCIIACKAHFWPGRSLPKGNQWEWWNPGEGPLPGLGEVGHSPRGTSGSAGTLDWGPMWLGSQSTCHPYTPWWPSMLPMAPIPQCPYNLRAPIACWCPLYPCWTWAPTLPASPPMHPWHPYTPWWPQHPSQPNTPMSPQCPLMSPIPLLAPKHLCSLPAPQCTPDALIPLLHPEGIHFLPAPNAPPASLDTPWHPLSPKTCTPKLKLLHKTERPTKWSGHGKMIDPLENFYIWKTFYLRG